MFLFDLAERLGIPVHWRRQMDDVGAWYPDHGCIALHEGRTWAEIRCVLGHELGHAVLGHEDDSPKNEAAADRWAANALLSADAVAECARHYPHNPEKWCHELDVTPDILRAWLRDRDNYAAAEDLLDLVT